MTSDLERAKAFLDPDYFRDEVMAEEVARLAAQFAAVRADERTRICAYLRREGDNENGERRTSVVWGAAHELADLIDRGEAS